MKTLDDVAKAVGEEVGNLKKLLKLNDLLPRFRTLYRAANWLRPPRTRRLSCLPRMPVEIVDGDPECLEYLLIADNAVLPGSGQEGQAGREFLKRYWSIRRGGSGANQYAGKNSEVLKEKNSPLKTLDDVAKAVGEEAGNLKKLLKLNDLIPPLQDLVSRGRLAQTAAYSLAFLPPEEQQHLLDVLGESGVCGLSVREAQELRRQLDAERKRLAEGSGGGATVCGVPDRP